MRWPWRKLKAEHSDHQSSIKEAREARRSSEHDLDKIREMRTEVQHVVDHLREIRVRNHLVEEFLKSVRQGETRHGRPAHDDR